MAKRDIELIARGLWWHRDTLLVCRNLKHGYCYLPGGHVEFSEAAASALAREFQEETGTIPRIGNLRATVELRFLQRGTERHELSLVFHVEQADSARVGSVPPTIKSREPKIGFEWVPIAKLSQSNFQPAALIPWLQTAQHSGSPAWLSFDTR